jgi:hypothetical protein
MNVDLQIEGSAGRARRLALPDSPRLNVWIVDLNAPAFVIGKHPAWHSQFAVSAAPIDMLPSCCEECRPWREGSTTHRLAFAPLSKPFDWLTGDRPVVSTAALASVDFAAADDAMAAHIVRALAGSLAAGILPVGGRHPRMAWHAACGAVAFALHQARAEVQG